MECITDKSEMSHLTQDLYLCEICGLVSSNIRPDPSIYDRSYEIKYDRYERSPAGEKIQKLRHDIVARTIFAGKRLAPWKLLDYGCGVGSFLKTFYGDMEVCPKGFDVNPYTMFCDPTVLMQEYDIITFWDSLEHVRNPADIIEHYQPRYIFVCTPSTDDCKTSMLHWRHYMPNEHCHYFNLNSLTAFLKQTGYRVLEYNYDESRPRAGGGDQNILTVAAEREDNGTH